MKKQLIWSMAFLFLIIFVVFGVIIVIEFGNPITYHNASKEIKKYINENYATLYDEFDVSSIRYQMKDDTYRLTVRDKRNKNLSFQIYYGKDKKVADTYQFDYVDGTNFRAITENKLTDTLLKRFKNNSFLEEFYSYRVAIQTPLNKLDKNIKEQLILNKNIEDLNIYTIESSTKVKQMNADNFAKKFEKLYQGTEEISFYPIAYSLFICKEDDGNNCIKIQNVTREVIKSENLTVLFQTMLQDKDKIKQKYQISYERIEKK